MTFDDITALESFYEKCNYILNPVAVMQMCDLKKSVQAILKLQDSSKTLSVEEGFDNSFGWTYYLNLKDVIFDLAGADMQLMKISATNCDSMSVSNIIEKGKTVGIQIRFEIHNVYLPC